MSVWFLLLSLLIDAVPDDQVLIERGRVHSVRAEGEWKTVDGALTGSGVGTVLWATPRVGPGEWTVKAKLSITELEGSAASFVIDGSHFGFEGRTGEMFVEGSLFGGQAMLGEPRVEEERAFALEVRRSNGKLTIEIDGETAHEVALTVPLVAAIGLRPHRATMHIESWSINGAISPSPIESRPPFETDVFVSGQEAYDTFRIPAAVRTAGGNLLAFAEGRRRSRSDTGDIDLVMRRSTDDGTTWSDLEVVWDDGSNTCGNPCPVVDRTTGHLWLLMTWNLGTDHESAIKAGTGEDSRRVFVCHSEDDGRTWSTPRDITVTTKHPEWRWYATGPGVGIQLTRGEQAGRLVIPCDHSSPNADVPSGYGSHVIMSDDHGASWRRGEALSAGVNECQVIEREDGSLLLNMRNYERSRTCRAIATSTDGGHSWSAVAYDPVLIEPVCQASLIRSRWSSESRPGVVLFANPASTDGRHHMTVRLSEDDGATWPVAKTVHAGSAAYSCLVALPNAGIGLLFERDEYRRITFARFDEAWLRK